MPVKIKQSSPDILKFSTEHEDTPSTLNCFIVPPAICLYFMQALIGWVLIIFGTQVIKKKRPVRSVFPDYHSVSYDYAYTKTLIPQDQKTTTSTFQDQKSTTSRSGN